MTWTPRTYGLAAAAASAIASVFELVRVIATGGVAHGETQLSAFLLGISFSVVLGIAALGLAMHRQLGWIAGVWGIIVALSYGVVLRAAGNVIGIAYMALSFVLFPLLVKSLPWYRSETVSAS